VNILKMAALEAQRKLILMYLKDNKFNQTKTAQALGVHRNTIIIKMRECKITKREVAIWQ